MARHSFDSLVDLPNDRTPIVGKFIYRPGTFTVAGRAKTSHKTVSLMDMCRHIGLGRDWLGHKVSNIPITYAFLEDDPALVGERLRKLGYQKGDAPFADAVFNVADAKAVLEGLASDRHPRLVIIDSLAKYAAAQGVRDENNSMEITNLLETIRGYAQASRSAIILVHHFRKADSVMRGSEAIRAATDGTILASPNEDGTVTWAWEPRASRTGDMTFRFRVENEDKDDERFYFDPAERPIPSAGPDAAVGPIMGSIRAILLTPPVRAWTKRELTAELGSRSGGRGAPKAERIVGALAALERDGDVQRTTGPKNVGIFRATPALVARGSAPPPPDGALDVTATLNDVG